MRTPSKNGWSLMECLTGKVENMQWGHSRWVKPTVMCCLCLLSLIIWVESVTPLTETVISSCYRNKIVWTARAGECLGLTVITQCWTMNLSNEDIGERLLVWFKKGENSWWKEKSLHAVRVRFTLRMEGKAIPMESEQGSGYQLWYLKDFF